MKATRIVRRFDDLGRINIPKELRKQLFGTPEKSEGMPIEIFMDKDDIILRKYETNDVCEWKKYLNYPYIWMVGCKPNLVASRQGDYCPYCGKKIKIVGD